MSNYEKHPLPWTGREGKDAGGVIIGLLEDANGDPVDPDHGSRGDIEETLSIGDFEREIKRLRERIEELELQATFACEDPCSKCGACDAAAEHYELGARDEGEPS